MRKELDDLLERPETARPLAENDIILKHLPTSEASEPPVRRRYFRPIKQSVTIRLDTDIVAWFKARAADGGYQTAINRALRDHMERHE